MIAHRTKMNSVHLCHTRSSISSSNRMGNRRTAHETTVELEKFKAHSLPVKRLEKIWCNGRLLLVVRDRISAKLTIFLSFSLVTLIQPSQSNSTAQLQLQTQFRKTTLSLVKHDMLLSSLITLFSILTTAALLRT